MYKGTKGGGGGGGGGGHQSIGGTGARRGRGSKTLHTGGRSAVRARDHGERDNNKSAKELEAERQRVRQADMLAWRKQRQAEGNAFDEAFGFSSPFEGAGEGGGNGEEPRVGWLINLLPTTTRTADKPNVEVAAVDCYFLQENGVTFKSTILHRPYFYIQIPEEMVKDAMNMLERRLEGQVESIEDVHMVDLDLPNHLSGKQGHFIKLSFSNVQELMACRRQILPLVQKNQKRHKNKKSSSAVSTGSGYGIMGGLSSNKTKSKRHAGADTSNSSVSEIPDDVLEAIIDIREYDVPYSTRVAIDLDLRCGAWYRVSSQPTSEVFGGILCDPLKDMLVKAEPRVLAFDIECTKAPLKFPDAEIDQVFMISYMFDGQGYLIINREVVSEDVEDFEYTPKPQYPGPFIIFNEADEASLLRRFFDHCQELRPNIWVTFNGDFFDWPFLDKRASKYNMVMEKEIGVAEVSASKNGGKQGSSKRNGEYRGRCSVHMDAFAWVNRDSYLPMGSRGLKAVTKYKLGYDPVEVNPEDMVRFASEQPQHMAAYSVSDAVATYYLYMKYVHNFIFSLATIIPMGPEDVLRKGSGTLCEMLLMVEAVDKGIVCPNKQNDTTEKFHDNKLLQNETYVGGHVECLESGVFRDDIPTKFELDPTAFEELIANVDRDLTFALEVENGVQRSDCENYDEIRANIIEQLEMLRDTPNREEEPVVYHLDVAAMYPNIILTNRLQPMSCAAGEQCPTCEYHLDYDKVHRLMPWTWRGDMYPASRSECASIRHQVEHEFAMERAQERDMLNRMRPQEAAAHRREQYANRGPTREERCELEIKKRLKDYCQKVYKKTKITVVEERVACVCQRENPFYVDTVRAFRDRRYVYKGLTKKWGKEVKKLTDSGNPVALMDAKNKSILYDSLQLAHKCILNSFYGYVMRRGARWYSMPMAAVTTRTGAMLITQARELVERVGRPLELDTDGIWCILPSSFPENFRLKMKNGKSFNISYPGTMLNTDVHKNYTNHQYQTLVDPRTLSYATHSECSIYFEVDGPYRCMVLPASQEKDRLLKKRYAVFNFDGSLAELKGFELKRRGELSIIKVFQSSVFSKFLLGVNLEECYKAVGAVADEWLDVLHNRGENLEDEELIELISENKSMSRNLADYGKQRSTAITVAKRLGDLIGMDQVKDAGLNCKLLITKFPLGGAITERAIPVVIFESEPAVMRHYIRKWSKDGNMSEEAGDFDIRNLIDWDYYVTRLNSCIQKIITIPAALQRIQNPVPRCAHPDWLQKVVREKLDPFKQKSMTNFFTQLATGEKNILKDVSHSSRDNVTAVSMEVDDDTGADGLVGESSHVATTEHDETTFDGWLKSRKEQWKLRRTRRKRLRGNAARSDGPAELLGSGERARALRGGMGSYMRANADALAMADYHWQILEIRATSPGIFRIFALTGPNVMEHFDVSVPRTLYTNSRVSMDILRGSESFQQRRVQRVLPRAHTAMHLYEVQLPESRYKRNEKTLSNFLTHPDLEGVYELGVPLLLRAVMELGCVVKPNKATIKERRRNKTPSSEPYRMDQLEMLTTAKYEYVEPRNNSYTYRRSYLFHSELDRRACVGLFVVDPVTRDANTGNTVEDVTSTVYVWLVDPTGNGARPNLRRIWKDYTGGRDGEFHFPKCKFILGTVPNRGAALAAAGSTLGELLRSTKSKNIPTICQIESSLEKSDILTRLPVLHEVPVVTMRSNTSDSHYPALGWQSFAVQRMLQRFILANGWWEDRLEYARYAHVPIGNFGTDAPSFVADIFFSRLLRRQDHLLWMSRTSTPDLGHGAGSMSGAASSSGGPSPSSGNSSAATAGHGAENSVSAPGAYRSICVELDIFNLAVNTMLEVGRLDELEGADGSSADFNMFAGGEDDKTMEQEDNDTCTHSFRVLRMLVQNWFMDVVKKDNPFADQLLVHFYRWVCSSSSLSHEPAVRSMLHRLMSKVFVRLVGEFERLGCTIVYADFNRLIISTNQRSLEAATGYMDYIVNTVQSNPLFSRITLQATKYWSSLLFMDRVNYGGVMLHHVDHSQVQAPPGGGESGTENATENTDMEKVVGVAEQDAEGDIVMADSSSQKVEKVADARLITGLEDSDEDDDVLMGLSGEGVHKKSLTHVEDSEDRADVDGNLANFIVDDDEVDYEEEEGDGSSKKRRRRKKNKKNNDAERSLNEMLSRAIVERHRNEEVEESDEDDESGGDMMSEAKRRRRREQQEQEDLAAAAGSTRGGLNIESHWNLLDYLPDACRDPFEAVIGKFIFKPLKWRMKYAEFLKKQAVEESAAAVAASNMDKIDGGNDDDMTKLRPEAFQVQVTGGGGEHSTGLGADDMARLKEAEDQYVRDELISRQLSEQLYDNLMTIQRFHYQDEFPIGPGSHVDTLTNPALEFVKAVTQVLLLDRSVCGEAVLLLKRNLLKMCKIPEFDLSAVWEDPCRSYTLQDVICPNCNYCRDLDLCRDPSLITNSSDEWPCPQCGSTYDKNSIELTLVQTIEEMSSMYQCQDLRCPETFQVQLGIMTDYCPESSKRYKCDISPEAVRKQLSTFLNIAKFHQFDWLEEVVSNLLQTEFDGYGVREDDEGMESGAVVEQRERRTDRERRDVEEMEEMEDNARRAAGVAEEADEEMEMEMEMIMKGSKRSRARHEVDEVDQDLVDSQMQLA